MASTTYTVLPDGTRCYTGPNCLRHGRGKQTLSPNFLDKPFKEQLEEMETIKNPLASQTPVQIDEVLATLYDVFFMEDSKLQQAKQSVEYYMNLFEKKGDKLGPYAAERYKKSLEEAQKAITDAEQNISAITKEMAPYQVEYRRRPWTRGYLVQNANGHVHKSMDCSTCTSKTRYLWLTDYSGSSENELVADAGEKACTVCYPSAPVDVLNRPAKLKNSVLDADRQKKADVAAAKLAKQLEAERKAITSPDGSPLYDTFKGVIKTEVRAESVASEIQSEIRAVDSGLYTIYNHEFAAQRREVFENVMEALAAKRNVTREELEVQLKKKFDARFKRDWSN